MKTFCQILIIIGLAIQFFAGLREDFYGKKAREPFGFAGAVITVVMTIVMALVFWQAGAFVGLFR